MRKRILAILCACICILGLAACGTDPRKVDYNGSTYEELEEYALSSWQSIQSMDVAEIRGIVEQIDALPEAQQNAFFSQNEGAKEQLALLRSWISVSEAAGNYVGVQGFHIDKSGKTTTTELTLEFDVRPVLLTIVYKNRDMSVESTNVDLVYTTGEKMQKALMNTVMGMGTVFIMLIVICLIISCFSLIPRLEKKLKDRKQPIAAQIPDQPAPAAEKAPEPVTDDYELVAVIAAAIAASTGQSTDDFVVRSIKRR